VERHSEGRIRLGASDAGMHAVGWLPRGTDVARLRQRAVTRGLYLRDVAAYYAARPREPGLVLNFASAAPATLTRGVVSLCRLID
jgi:GntR family transcriptional regulator / MocR family aminotransferase